MEKLSLSPDQYRALMFLFWYGFVITCWLANLHDYQHLCTSTDDLWMCLRPFFLYLKPCNSCLETQMGLYFGDIALSGILCETKNLWNIAPDAPSAFCSLLSFSLLVTSWPACSNNNLCHFQCECQITKSSEWPSSKNSSCCSLVLCCLKSMSFSILSWSSELLTRPLKHLDFSWF